MNARYCRGANPLFLLTLSFTDLTRASGVSCADVSLLLVNCLQVKWVNKGVERGETLVSISTDGRVVEWSMKKGLSYSALMVLKRIGQLSLCCRVSKARTESQQNKM